MTLLCSFYRSGDFVSGVLQEFLRSHKVERSCCNSSFVSCSDLATCVIYAGSGSGITVVVNMIKHLLFSVPSVVVFIGCEIVLEKARKSRSLIHVFKFIEEKIRTVLGVTGTPKCLAHILAHAFQDCLNELSIFHVDYQQQQQLMEQVAQQHQQMKSLTVT